LSVIAQHCIQDTTYIRHLIYKTNFCQANESSCTRLAHCPSVVRGAVQLKYEQLMAKKQ